ncbi:ABC transporter permease subunit [Lyngbya aestuarii]|uniref:ABC transporter permease subunit n=1 Tax=Lyngbya aestuarii TaxID=118322 RepID=UPI00403E2661
MAEPPVTKEKKRPRWQWLEPLALLGPAGIWLALLLVLPTLVIFELSLVPNIRPGDLVNPSGLDNYFRVFEPINLQVIGRSVFFAVGSTVICLLLGFPVAYWIAQLAPKRWQNLLLVGFILPLWTSSLLRSYAWITILRPTGVLNTFLLNPLKPLINPLLEGLNAFLQSLNNLLEAISLPSVSLLPLLPWNLLNEWPAVLIGMAYSFLPYMVLILYASLEKLDQRLLEASADLGANPWQTFWKVTVPQTMPGITAGCLLVFISGLGDFVDPELLGGASSMTVARLIYNQFLGPTQNWGFGSALSMVLIVAVSMAIALWIKYGDTTVEP